MHDKRHQKGEHTIKHAGLYVFASRVIKPFNAHIPMSIKPGVTVMSVNLSKGIRLKRVASLYNVKESD